MSFVIDSRGEVARAEVSWRGACVGGKELRMRSALPALAAAGRWTDARTTYHAVAGGATRTVRHHVTGRRSSSDVMRGTLSVVSHVNGPSGELREACRTGVVPWVARPAPRRDSVSGVTGPGRVGGLPAQAQALADPPTAAARGAGVDLTPQRGWSALGAHSMLYVDSPYAFKERMFRAAAGMGAATIRVDIALSGIFHADGSRDWRGVDEYIELSRRFGIRILADVLATPWWLAACPPDVPFSESHRCATDDPAAYGRLVGELVAHSRGSIDLFELVNEPDARWAFLGDAQQYARMLAAGYDAVHAANPQARVLLGGLMSLESGAPGGWLDEVVATPGANAGRKFDIANVHVRGGLDSVPRQMRHWRERFGALGFDGPLWVTEHGYPSDPARQVAPFNDGPRGQARFLARSVPLLLARGAEVVFVTERDNLDGDFASEGVLGGPVADPPTADARPLVKPAFTALRALATQAEEQRGRARPARAPSGAR